MVSVIVVDYNSMEKTLDYIEDFSSSVIDKKQFAYIIVDNNEINDSLNQLCVRFGEYELTVNTIFEQEKKIYIFNNDSKMVLYCYNGKNVGYAKGNNIGAEISNQLIQADYYIVCNNDLKIPNKFDFNCLKDVFDNNKNVAVIGPRIVDLKGKPQSPRKKISVLKKLFLYCWLSTWPFRKDVDMGDSSVSGTCYWVSGAFLIICADKFKKCKGFDEGTFLFCEEMILAERLLQFGFSMYYYKELEVIHEHGYSMKKSSAVSSMDKWLLESTQYYCKKYRKTPQLIIWLSSANYYIYVFAKKIRQMMVFKK